MNAEELRKRFPGRRARNAAGVLASILLLVCVVFGVELHARYQWAYASLERIEPRYARLAGLQASADQIRQALEVSRQNLARFVYPASIPLERVGAEAQQRARELAAAKGLAVINSRIEGGGEEGGLERVSIILTVQGNGEQLQQMLVGLAETSPVMFLQSARLQGPRGRTAADRVTAQLNLIVNKVKQ